MRLRKALVRAALAAVLAVGLLPSTALAQEAMPVPEEAGALFKATAAKGLPSARQIIGTAAVDGASDGEASALAADGMLYVVGEDLYDYAYQVLGLVNQQRAANGLGALSMDRELLDAAMCRAAECSVYFSHTRPNGEQCFEISGKMFGENIAAGQWSPAMVMDSWMNSPGHRSNILNARWNSIGIGCFRGADGVLYWTQAFGSSLANPVSQPANRLGAWSVYVDSNLAPVSLDPILVDAAGNAQKPPVWLYVGEERDAMALGSSTGEGGWGSSSLIAGESFAWTSSNPNVLSVDGHGRMTAKAAGTARLTGTSGVFHVAYDVTVGYSDVAAGEWYEKAVQFASQSGLIAGYGGTTLFGVGDPVTRAQLATILWRYAKPNEAAAYDNIASNETGMSDVSANQYWTAAANWAVENGVINGVAHPDGSRTFDPEGSVTREQCAVILANFNGIDVDAYDVASLDAFPDAAGVDGWAVGGLAWAVDNGVINGADRNGVRYLNAAGPVVREQMATILMNAIQNGVL